MSRVRRLSVRCRWAIVLGATVLSFAAERAAATPPAIPGRATAQSELDALVVAPEGTMAGYARELFPHWIIVSGTCSAREAVLRRDGSGVSVDAACRPTSGSWFSQYDAVTLTSAACVDIDHVVPLAEAWRSGASSWTTSRRQSFANDLVDPQLIAVSAASNRAKSDQDPAAWQPRAAYVCMYAELWIGSKHAWDLRLQPAEKSALQAMLNTCAP